MDEGRDTILCGLASVAVSGSGSGMRAGRGNSGSWTHRARAGAAIRRSLVLAPALVLGLALLGSTTGVASAHAYYVSSTPEANSTVATAPTTITIHFAEHVNPTGSAVIVLDAKGNTVSTGPAQLDPSDLTVMTVNMKGDGSEIYLVQWHTVSADDGDPDVGAFTFNVGASTTPTATPSGGTRSGSGSSGTPGWLVALVGVLGLVIGAAGGMLYARRSAGTAS
jgi:copper resistance protein C